MPADRCTHGFLRSLCPPCGGAESKPLEPAVREESVLMTELANVELPPADSGLGAFLGLASLLGWYGRLLLFAFAVGFTGCSELEVPAAVTAAPAECSAGILDSAGRFVCVEISPTPSRAGLETLHRPGRGGSELPL